MALVKIRLTEPAETTALISNESVKDLEIKVGDQVEETFKATEIRLPSRKNTLDRTDFSLLQKLGVPAVSLVHIKCRK
jgi:hypothetical protein